MSTSHAEIYGRRAKRARTVEEVGDNVKRAIDELRIPANLTAPISG
jgi:hypothetical protein